MKMLSLRWLAATGLFCFVLGLTPAADAAANLLGTIVSVQPDAKGNAVVSGWACRRGEGSPVSVHLYAALPYPAGQVVFSGVADRSVPGSQPCGASGHGFELTLPSRLLFRYGGLRVFAYAVVPREGAAELAGSGAFRLPEYMPQAADTPRRCVISDMSTLKACFARQNAYDMFVLKSRPYMHVGI